MKSPFSAVVSTSLISVGLATDARENIISGVICFSVAELWSTFVALLQSPSDIVTSASFASSDTVSFSVCTIFWMYSSNCSFGSGLNLNIAHLLCIGSIILLL